MMPQVAFSGAKYLGKATLVEVWGKLHRNAVAWAHTFGDASLLGEVREVERSAQQLVQQFKDLPADEWHALCSAAGPTVYGAVALSWCRDAEIAQVWDIWRASGFPLKPLPEFERPARLINPEHIPKTNSLAEIAEIAGNNNLPICAMIAALEGPLDFDVAQDMLRNAPPQVASFLKSRMLQKSDRTKAENQLIDTWTVTVAGSEYDVWVESCKRCAAPTLTA